MGKQQQGRQIDRIAARYFIDWINDRVIAFERWGVCGYRIRYMDTQGAHRDLITRHAATIQEMCVEVWECELAAGRFRDRWWLDPDESSVGPLFDRVRHA